MKDEQFVDVMKDEQFVDVMNEDLDDLEPDFDPSAYDNWPLDSNPETITYNNLIVEITERFIANFDPDDLDATIIENELLSQINQAITTRNLGPRNPEAIATDSLSKKYPKRKQGVEAYQPLKTLIPYQIARLLVTFHNVSKIAASGLSANPEYDILGMYQLKGENKGIYVTNDDDIRRMARSYNPSLSKREYDEILLALRDIAPRKIRCLDRDIIAVNNGLFNYKEKKLHPFDPDYVFLSKCQVDYTEDPVNPVIEFVGPDQTKQEWDVVSWMSSLSDDPDIVNTLWEICSAIIRPNVRWNKSAWLYSEVGNNGKGTLCTLMRNLCGESSYASIPLKDFSKDFMLEPLTSASAIIVDENDVGTYLDAVANLKAIITNDVISINRKFKVPIAYQFFGFMVQCVNEMPQVKDRSNSFYRRQLFIPMNKRFAGIEIPQIKNDFLYRQDVLQYVLHKCLNTNFYVLSEPEACRNTLEEYKERNDPVRQFWQEVEERAVWDVLPYSFLYDLYKSWVSYHVPSGQSLSSRNFRTQLIQLVELESDVFEVPLPQTSIHVGNKMDEPELMIDQYQVRAWMDSSYQGPDVRRKCVPNIKSKNVRGLLRRPGAPRPMSQNDESINVEPDSDSKD